MRQYYVFSRKGVFIESFKVNIIGFLWKGRRSYHTICYCRVTHITFWEQMTYSVWLNIQICNMI